MDITREDLRNDLRSAFKDVMSDHDLIEGMFEPLISKVVLAKMTDKFEKTLGVDCTDYEQREQLKEDLKFLRKVREWSETEKGEVAITTFKRLMVIVDFAASGAVKAVVYLLIAGALTLITLGAVTQKSVKALLGI